MEQHKEQKNTANDLRKYEKLQQKSLALIEIVAYITDVVYIKGSLSESHIAKFVASSYLETSVSTLDITLSTSLSGRRRSGTSSFMETCVPIIYF